MAVYTGAKRAVVCVSGTNALHMAMLLVGVERDEPGAHSSSDLHRYLQCCQLYRSISCFY